MGNEQPQQNQGPPQYDVSDLKFRIELTIRKTNEYVKLQIGREKGKQMTMEQELVRMMTSPNRKKQDEYYKIQAIANVINYINGAEIVQRYLEILLPKSLEIAQNIYQPEALAQYMPFIESIVWSTEQLNLNSLVEFSNLMKSLFGQRIIEVANSPNIDKDLRKYLSTSIASGEEMNAYIWEWSQTGNIGLDEINQVGHEFFNPQFPPPPPPNFGTGGAYVPPGYSPAPVNIPPTGPSQPFNPYPSNGFGSGVGTGGGGSGQVYIPTNHINYQQQYVPVPPPQYAPPPQQYPQFVQPPPLNSNPFNNQPAPSYSGVQTAPNQPPPNYSNPGYNYPQGDSKYNAPPNVYKTDHSFVPSNNYQAPPPPPQSNSFHAPPPPPQSLNFQAPPPPPQSNSFNSYDPSAPPSNPGPYIPPSPLAPSDYGEPPHPNTLTNQAPSNGKPNDINSIDALEARIRALKENQ